MPRWLRHFSSRGIVKRTAPSVLDGIGSTLCTRGKYRPVGWTKVEAGLAFQGGILVAPGRSRFEQMRLQWTFDKA